MEQPDHHRTQVKLANNSLTHQKRLPKLLISLLAAALFALLSVGFSACNARPEKLLIYNWTGYISPDAVDAFPDYYYEHTGKRIEVVYSTFDSNETMITTLVKGKAEVDLVCPSDYAIQKLLQLDFLSPLNYSKIPNVTNVYPLVHDKIFGAFGAVDVNGELRDMTLYSTPYMWGSFGVLYNADIISKESAEAAGWGLLWNENLDGSRISPLLNGKILMKENIRETYAAAVLYLAERGKLPKKYDGLTTQALINTVEPEILSTVERALSAQKPLLKGYEVDFGKDDLIVGNAYVDLAWNGDALYAIEEAAAVGVNLDYFVPALGGAWFDGWTVPKNAPNPDAAHWFINYLYEPSTAMMNTYEIGYTNCLNPEILAEFIEVDADAAAMLEDWGYTPEEFFNDPRRYPKIDDTFGIINDFNTEQSELIVAMWERVKSDTRENSNGLGELAVPVWLFAGSASFILILILAYCFYQKWYLVRPRRITRVARVTHINTAGGLMEFFLLRGKKNQKPRKRDA
ncbi:MAG: extracellular solute-binding protein [Clostridiaceae bacterium]|jgi:spermidine/putrescine transport system substrate-binding protein|nr:extracellular solute-binding protein [Clostridiaceae bacterium]